MYVTFRTQAENQDESRIVSSCILGGHSNPSTVGAAASVVADRHSRETAACQYIFTKTTNTRVTRKESQR